MEGRHTIFLADDAATADLGGRLAALLRPGDLVALEGGLGAGKTALTRAIVRRLMGDGTLEVPSPTFALVQPYRTAAGTSILHADLYRIGSEIEIEELGLSDLGEEIALVEWAERAPRLLSGASVRIRLSVPESGEGRDADIQFDDGRTLT